jgi:carbonic anhydrase
MKSFSILAITSLLLILLIQVSVNFAASDSINYSYSGFTGPEFWSNVNKNCSGKHQSPIDIPYKEFMHFSKPNYVKFDDSFNVEVENKQYTIEISKKSESLDAKMKIGNDIYELSQFHFHTPSEHQIDGLHHDVEAHFVFTYKEKISVIGVFYDVSDHDNEFLEPIIAKVKFIFQY